MSADDYCVPCGGSGVVWDAGLRRVVMCQACDGTGLNATATDEYGQEDQ